MYGLRDFRLLWAAQAVSALGSRITRTALPVMAVLTIDSTPLGLALLSVLQVAPAVLVALVAGGFIDRSRKRPILVAADLVRAAAVVTIPLAALAGALTLAHLFAVGAVVGAASALFAITDNAYLPALVGRQHLVQGNTVIEATQSVAEVAGPGVAGVLIQILSAPFAVLFDVVSYLGSAVLLGAIRQHEQPAETGPSPGVWRDLVTGFRASWDHPMVRPLLLAQSVAFFFGGFFMALYMLFTLDVLGLQPATVGIVIAMGGVGALLGALASSSMTRRLGLGRALFATLALASLGGVLIPAASGPTWVVLLCLFVHQLMSDGFSTAFSVQAVSLRQSVLPLEVLGRSNAAFQALTGGMLPLGALTAGALAHLWGVRTSLWIGMSCSLLAPALLLPLWRVRELSSPPP